jgi:hypothetical protein
MHGLFYNHKKKKTMPKAKTKVNHNRPTVGDYVKLTPSANESDYRKLNGKIALITVDDKEPSLPYKATYGTIDRDGCTDAQETTYLNESDVKKLTEKQVVAAIKKGMPIPISDSYSIALHKGVFRVGCQKLPYELIKLLGGIATEKLSKRRG